MEQYAIGLMSGTSADGVDAVLISISGYGTSTKIRQIAGLSVPYEKEMRDTLLRMAGGGECTARDFCLINVLLGQKFADACEAVAEKAGIKKSDIAFAGSHGHTFWHVPVSEPFAGSFVRGTLQLGDPAPIRERIGCKVVSDFRCADMAAGGQGAPLVPYVDWLLYRSENEDTALQNIGGIANITLLPRNCSSREILGFDTGPGNMVIDALATHYFPALRYDPDGSIAKSGTVSEDLLHHLMDDPYYAKRPPKSTGREKYDSRFVAGMIREGERIGLRPWDVIATATALTAYTIADAITRFSPFGQPGRLIVSGGGAHNKTLLDMLSRCLDKCRILTQEALGFDSDMKEAIAFAILANDCLNNTPNNVPASTGAAHPVVMGRITP